jgi:hypothetical protein
VAVVITGDVFAATVGMGHGMLDGGAVVVGRLGVGVEVDVVDWSGGGGTGLWTAGDGPVDGVDVVAWLCAGDCTGPAAWVREPIGGAGVGGAGAGVVSEVPENSPSRFRLMPRVVLSLRPSAVAFRRI